ncbi:MAG: NADH-quinone oxidoreductase subunit N [Planctomycetota bacterium]|nr:NADH-quinone oxidoreductase subunit N [Planctomycetota bacterium]
MIDLLHTALAADLPAALAAASPMAEKLRYLIPEIILFTATFAVLVTGLSPSASIRRLSAAISALALIAAGLAALNTPTPPTALLPNLIPFSKVLIAAVGLLLVLLVAGTVDRDFESAIDRGTPFDAIRATRGEFYAFILFSLTGLMLCATADDLIWLFLALELTSLPTYVMVSISTARTRSQEAGIKYFFLGALGAAFFLYGFTLLYGATGTTLLFGNADVPGIAQILAAQLAQNGQLGALALTGLVISMVGVGFKIAAVPMHFYTPDVYEGAASSVSGYLAFVPKAAGIITLILLASTVGWTASAAGGLPEPIRVFLWVVAAMTMTVGNVLALLQSNVKRVLAYSSIAHSGYLLVGIITGPASADAPVSQNGLAASLFYLLCYGFMNLGAFAVLASLERSSRRAPGEEIETFDDLKGLCSTHPLQGWAMILCALSLAGLPPLLGFWGKLYLFTSAIAAGEILLVIVMGLNSAIALYYYLRLAATPFMERASGGAALTYTPSPTRRLAALLSAASVVLLVPFTWWLIRESDRAAEFRPAQPARAALIAPLPASAPPAAP